MRQAIKFTTTDICSRCNKKLRLSLTLWLSDGYVSCEKPGHLHTPKNHIKRGAKWYFRPYFNKYLEILTSDL